VLPEDQVIRYADIGGPAVAWSSVGSGPVLVIGGWWSSHLELDWRDPLFREFVGMLAQHRTVVRYDRVGTGMSDRSVPLTTTLEQELDTLTRLIDAIGADRVDLMGASSGGPVVAAYAAAHPDRVDHVVMYGSYLRGSSIATPAARDTLLGVVEHHWGLGSRVFADMFLPDASATEREAFAEFQRDSATRETALASLRTVFALDGSPYASAIVAPTLVVHRRDDRAIPFALGRELAREIPGATFVALDGLNHLPWRGDARALADVILGFLGVAVDRQPAPTARAELSARELEVLALVARGLTDQEIAAELVLSAHTVHRHVANVRTKLGVASRAAAAVWATENGLI
jgi:pimeloyl-ACP methyl ester carboxylesterase/DNA-binding CsgD family transcriptional regulator